MGKPQTGHAERVFRLVDRWNRRSGTASGGGFGRAIAESWHRSLAQHGLDPERRTGPMILEGAELARRRDRLGAMYPIALAEMENLYRQTTGSGYSILLTDADGLIVHRLGDPSLERDFSRAGLLPGANWSEASAGTNGIGTAIHEQAPLTVHRDEHFLTGNVALSCSAAPIHDPQGQLLAVLDASSTRATDTRASQRHTMALVNMAAHTIENAHFLGTQTDHWILRFHPRPEFVGLLHEGMLALDDEGRIIAANHSAVVQLHARSPQELIGRAVTDLLGVAPETVQGTLARDGSIQPIGRGAGHFFATVRAPRGQGRPPAVRTPTMLRMPSPQPSLDVLSASGDPVLQENVRRARRLLDRDVPLVITGETGTGKEIFARAIHGASARARRPFVAINCSAIPAELIESELFGYRSGAFTGARREGARGKILQADGGTLFLDEIGDMPLALQTRLLRVLEQGEVVPLGGEEAVPVQLHLISATHRRLDALVASGQFREDLYYRLNGFTLELPPLRQRRDLASLLHRILDQETAGETEVHFTDEALDALLAYRWPGNVRQLRHVLRAASGLCEQGLIRLADLPGELRDGARSAVTAASTPCKERVERAASPEHAALLAALHRHRWNISRAARELGISRNTFYRRLRRHGIALPGRNP